jgi:hypothetical protein
MMKTYKEFENRHCQEINRQVRQAELHQQLYYRVEMPLPKPSPRGWVQRLAQMLTALLTRFGLSRQAKSGVADPLAMSLLHSKRT